MDTQYAQEFREQGYTILRGFFNEQQMDELIEEIKIADPKQSQPSGLNKGALRFYSNLFFHSSKLQRFLTAQRLIDFLKTVIGPDMWIRWDQAVAKGPGAPEFPWHQDNGYNLLKNEHYQLWIALSKMNHERGGLWLVPGSHKAGLLPHNRTGGHMAVQGEIKNALCVEAEPGDVVLFSSLMLHYTSPNVSQHDRWAYVVEYMNLAHYDPYLKGPYFVAARNGFSRPEFVRIHPASLSLPNQMKYFVPRLQRGAGRIKSLARGGLRRLVS